MEQFKTLTSKEETEFRQWARDNYTAGDAILGVWHPVVRAECLKISARAKARERITERQYMITAKQITSFKELDDYDQEWLSVIIDPFVVNAINEEKALDAYHGTVPIACLEDFEISCKCID